MLLSCMGIGRKALLVIASRSDAAATCATLQPLHELSCYSDCPFGRAARLVVLWYITERATYDRLKPESRRL